jgi:hypothetical protein
MASLAWRKRSPIEVWDIELADGGGGGWERDGPVVERGRGGPEPLAYWDYRFVATSL